jgi:hypothetical protein
MEVLEEIYEMGVDELIVCCSRSKRVTIPLVVLRWALTDHHPVGPRTISPHYTRASKATHISNRRQRKSR